LTDYLLDTILNAGLRAVAVIGMAKNAGKTTVLNHLMEESTRRRLRIATASIGRDGEDYDAVTLKKKPRVLLPAGSVFITTDRLVYRQVAAGKLRAELVEDLNLDTVLGRVGIYRTAGGGEAELAGLNRISGMMEVKDRMVAESDLFLIDGALNRRSSAVPSLADGIILATGAVLGRDIPSVIRATRESVDLLSLPRMETFPPWDMIGEESRDLQRDLLRDLIGEARRALAKGVSLHIHSGRNMPLTAVGEPVSPRILRNLSIGEGDILAFQGALTESLAEALFYRRDLPPCTLLVRDGTRVFVTPRSLKLLASRGMEIRVLDPMKITAITSNPHNPMGQDLHRNQLLEALRTEFAPLPVFDVELNGARGSSISP